MSIGADPLPPSASTTLARRLAARDWASVQEQLRNCSGGAGLGLRADLAGSDFVAELLEQMAACPPGKQGGLLRAARRRALADTETASWLAAAVVNLDLPWPHHEPARLTDQEVVEWCWLLERAPRLDERSFEFLRQVLKARQREQWVPAARVLGRLAARQPEQRSYLAQTASELLHAGHPRWSGVAGKGPSGKLDGPNVHALRHGVILLAAWWAADRSNAEGAGVSGEALLAKLPRDLHHLSSLVHAAAALAPAMPSTAVIEAFAERALELSVDQLGQTDQLAAAFVELARTLPPERSATGIRWLQRLVAQPSRSQSTQAALGYLAARLVVAVELARRLEMGELSAFLASMPELETVTLLELQRISPAVWADDNLSGWVTRRLSATLPFLSLITDRQPAGRFSAWATEVVGRLAPLASAQRWRLVHPLAQAETSELILRLLDLPEHASVEWGDLTTAAGWSSDEATRTYSVNGPVGEVGALGVVLGLAALGVNPDHLVRRTPMDAERALSLAGRRHPFLDTQLALAIERKLRRTSNGRSAGADETTDRERLHWLYRLMQVRPREKLWVELSTLARDEGLRTAAQACLAFVRESDLSADGVSDPDRYLSLLDDLQGSLPGARSGIAGLRCFARRIEGARQQPMTTAIVDSLALLLGTVGAPGDDCSLVAPVGDVVSLLQWCALDGYLELAEQIAARHCAVGMALQAVRASLDLHALGDSLRHLEEQLERLDRTLDSRLPQPEEKLLHGLLARLIAEVGRQQQVLRAFQLQMTSEASELQDPSIDGFLARLQLARQAAHTLRDHLNRAGLPDLAALQAVDRILEERTNLLIEQTCARKEEGLLLSRATSALRGLTLSATGLTRLADHQIERTLHQAREAEVLALLEGEGATPGQNSSSIPAVLSHASDAQLGELQNWLHGRCLLGAAARLRRLTSRGGDSDPERRQAAAPRLTSGFLSYFAPLFVGVSFGTFQILDVGTVWNDLVRAGQVRVIVCLGLVALVAPLVYMVLRLRDPTVVMVPIGFRRRSAHPRTEGRSQRLFWHVARVMPLYGVCLFIALLSSALVLVLMRGHSTLGNLDGCEAVISRRYTAASLAVLQLFLWTSMTLFLGVFLGLIAQGRKIGGRS